MSNNNISKLTPEMLVPRMGEYIVQKGMISEDDLQKVLSFQQEQARLGQAVYARSGVARVENA